ncbi:MAG TPA: hypothetical protein DCS43_11675 [Verrucomicrobia bacterium]|nr:hypothetical protein [Verrucomicrobiota bacterium]
MSISNTELLETAIAAATVGGRHALVNRHRRKESVSTYAHDVKLVLDVECQAKIETFIRRRYPDHAFLGEEDETVVNGQAVIRSGRGAAVATQDTLEWIVDPIDGTVNFSAGLRLWCCSVAVRRGETVLAGAVYMPMLDTLYAATVDGPATCNGEPIHVSDCRNLAEGIVMTGMDRDIYPGVPPLGCFERISGACRRARIAGSAAIDLCWLAEGGADGYFEGSIYLWDIAAAGLIAERAGATTEILARRAVPNQLTYLASNGHVHAQLKAALPFF